jgi:hypothetical protein
MLTSARLEVDVEVGGSLGEELVAVLCAIQDDGGVALSDVYEFLSIIIYNTMEIQGVMIGEDLYIYANASTPDVTTKIYSGIILLVFLNSNAKHYY